MDEAISQKILCFEYPESWTDMEIYSLSDIHVGDPLLDVNMFRRFVKSFENKERARIILNGDLMNNAVKTSVSNVYNETIPPNEQRKWLVNELSPIRDKLLCSIEGNHERRSKKDVDLSQTEWVADMLHIPYFENFSCMKVSFGKKSRDGRIVSYTIFATHGSSGGSLLGSALNKGERFLARIENCDLLVLGHSHKKAAGKIGSLVIDPRNNCMSEVEKGILVSSHWSSFGGYASRAMMAPSARGCCYARLDGREKRMEIVL